MAEGKKVAAGCGPCAIDDLQKNQGQAFEHCQHGSARRPLAQCAERCVAWESEGTANSCRPPREDLQTDK